MVKVDLITGFLGSGKTTFIKKYARYWLDQGKRICILENDYGAVNVDMMLLQDLMAAGCDLEMVAGGCDYDCHRRRFKTKLISMGMLGYDRVLIEPSGVFDVDEFFDILEEEPLDRWYEIGSVIAIVNAGLELDLSQQSRYLLASQIASAGCLLFSRSQEVPLERRLQTVSYLNAVLEEVQCKRRFSEEILDKDWAALDAADFSRIAGAGYKLSSHLKLQVEQENTFDSVYFMNTPVPDPAGTARALLADSECGHVIRVKGFIKVGDGGTTGACKNGAGEAGDSAGWLELNANHDGVELKPIENGQEVVIVIGEDLVEEKIKSYF